MFCLLLEYVASKPKHILPSLAQKVYPDPSPRGISLNVLKHSVVFHILQRALLFILVITTPPQSFKILNTINSMTLTFQEHPHCFFFLRHSQRRRDYDKLLLSCLTKHLPQCLAHSRCLISLSWVKWHLPNQLLGQSKQMFSWTAWVMWSPCHGTPWHTYI